MHAFTHYKYAKILFDCHVTGEIDCRQVYLYIQHISYTMAIQSVLHKGIKISKEIQNRYKRN